MSKRLLLLLIPVILITCKKSPQLEICKKNCKSFILKGRIYDATINKGFSNTPFKVRMESFRGNCIFCLRNLNDIYIGKTDKNGDFSISVTIDSTLLQDYSVKLITSEKRNYYKAFTDYISNSNLNQGTIIQIPFYQQANLTLNIVRTQSDTFNSLRVAHSWKRINTDGKTTFIVDYWGPMMKQKSDTTFNIITASDILTTVTITKSADGFFKDEQDSLICKRGEKNVLRINY